MREDRRYGRKFRHLPRRQYSEFAPFRNLREFDTTFVGTSAVVDDIFRADSWNKNISEKNYRPQKNVINLKVKYSYPLVVFPLSLKFLFRPKCILTIDTSFFKLTRRQKVLFDTTALSKGSSALCRIHVIYRNHFGMYCDSDFQSKSLLKGPLQIVRESLRNEIQTRFVYGLDERRLLYVFDPF